MPIWKAPTSAVPISAVQILLELSLVALTLLAPICAMLAFVTPIFGRLNNANLTGVKLGETQRTGWSIKDIICRHAFWDRNGKQLTEYDEGEFERAFADKPRIVLGYPGGMSPIDIAMLPLIVQRLQAEHSGCALHISSLHDDGDGALVTITVDNITNSNSGLFAAEVEVLRDNITTLQQQLQQKNNVNIALEAEFRGYQTAARYSPGKAAVQADRSAETGYPCRPTHRTDYRRGQFYDKRHL